MRQVYVPAVDSTSRAINVLSQSVLQELSDLKKRIKELESTSVSLDARVTVLEGP